MGLDTVFVEGPLCMGLTLSLQLKVEMSTSVFRFVRKGKSEVLACISYSYPWGSILSGVIRMLGLLCWEVRGVFSEPPSGPHASGSSWVSFSHNWRAQLITITLRGHSSKTHSMYVFCIRRRSQGLGYICHIWAPGPLPYSDSLHS